MTYKWPVTSTLVYFLLRFLHHCLLTTFFVITDWQFINNDKAKLMSTGFGQSFDDNKTSTLIFYFPFSFIQLFPYSSCAYFFCSTFHGVFGETFKTFRIKNTSNVLVWIKQKKITLSFFKRLVEVIKRQWGPWTVAI